jgi:hypothetical protein
MKPELTVESTNSTAAIIPFPVKPEPKKELTYTETYDAVWDTIHALEVFYKKGQHLSPMEVCKALIEKRIEKKYRTGGRI